MQIFVAVRLRVNTYIVLPRLLFLLVASDYDVNDLLAVGAGSSRPRHLFKIILSVNLSGRNKKINFCRRCAQTCAHYHSSFRLDL